MNMMRKMSLLALAVCAAGAVSTAAHADDKSWGTASAKVTINAAQEWTIAKKQDGELNIDPSTGGAVSRAAGGNAAGQWPAFTISNKTQADGVFYIKGSGTSLGTNNDIYMVNNADATKKALVKAYTSDDSSSALTWDGTALKWKGPSVKAGENQDVILTTVASTGKVSPGEYTVSIELFVPSE